jgi:hypothetical protein
LTTTARGLKQTVKIGAASRRSIARYKSSAVDVTRDLLPFTISFQVFARSC